MELDSSHGSHVNGRRIGAFEATLLREGACVAFGASSRSYTLQGTGALPPSSRWEEEEGGDPSGGERHGPALPGEAARKRKWTPADAKLKRRQKWLRGPKSASQMSENERVARSAGSGSGCFGPGFD